MSRPLAAAPLSNPPLYPQHDDEISLVDLWLVLARRKKLIWVITALCLIAGAMLGATQPKKYKFTTTLEVGRLAFNATGDQLLESPEAVLAKIKESFIPTVLEQYGRERGDNAYAIKLTADVPKGSQLVVLEGEGVVDAASAILSLHTQIAALVRKSQTERYTSEQKRVANKIEAIEIELRGLQQPGVLESRARDLTRALNEVQRKLDALNDSALIRVEDARLHADIAEAKTQRASLIEGGKLLTTRLSNLAEEEAALRISVERLNRDLDKAQQSTTSAVQANESNKVVTLMLIESSMQQKLVRLERLEQRLYADYPKERANLIGMITDNQRLQAEQESKIALLELQTDRVAAVRKRDKEALASEISLYKVKLEQLAREYASEIEGKKNSLDALKNALHQVTETRLLEAPTKADVSKMGLISMTLLATVLGLMLGLFAAFLAEFRDKARGVPRAH